MKRATGAEKKSEALRLRQEERLTLNEIHRRTGVAKGTLSLWLQCVPLSSAELKKSMGGKGFRTPKKDRGEQSRLYSRFGRREFSPHEKARIAEAAVLLRLSLLGFTSYTPIFDGERVDWAVEVPGIGFKKVQVRWANESSTAELPIIGLRKTEGHNKKVRYGVEDFDFLVGYDFYTDICYVWGHEETRGNNTSISICTEAEERWDKLGAIVQWEDAAVASRKYEFNSR